MAWTERYVRSDADGLGDGTTDANSGGSGSWTWAQMLTTAAAGHRVNIKAGTYSLTTTTSTLTNAGTTATPIFFRGFNTTIGDIDSDFTLAAPSVVYTTGFLDLNKVYTRWSNIAFSGATNTAGAGVLRMQQTATTVDPAHFDNCSFTNTGANANGFAVYHVNSLTVTYSRCRFQATSTATAIIDSTTPTGSPCVLFAGCVFNGGGIGIKTANTTAAAHYVFYRTCFRAVGGVGISDAGTAGSLYILGCSSRGGGGDFYKSTATRTGRAQVVIIDTAMGDTTGWGIDSSSATSGNFHRVCNLFGNNSSGSETGLGDTPSQSEQSDGGSSPFNTATDLTLAATSAGRAKSLPLALFSGEAFQSYGDIGAVRHVDPAGGGPVARQVIVTNIGTY